MNDLKDEQRLARSLHQTAEGLRADQSPIALDDVKRSARGLQWRRRATSGLVAAAVVAIAVPVGLSFDDGATRGERPIAPATSTPSVPAPTDSVVALTTQGAEQGAAATITYLVGRALVPAEGNPVELPAAYDSIAPFRSGWLAVERREGTPYVVELDADLQVVSARPGGDRIAVSADGTELSWFVAGDNGEPGELVRAQSSGRGEGEDSVPVPAGRTASPVGFFGPGVVIYGIDGNRAEFWSTDFRSASQRVDGVLKVSAVSEARPGLAVQTSYNDDGTSCWAVSTETGVRRARSCEWTYEAFSPDGGHLVGYPSDTDGIGASAVAILDTETGDPVVTFEREGQAEVYVNTVVWEDESHVLATVYESGRWHLLRLGLDGSLEQVDDASGEPESAPFRFAARP